MKKTTQFGLCCIACSIITSSMAMILLEGPGANSDFSSHEGKVAKVEVTRTDKGDTDYFEIWVSLQNGERFFIRRPDRERLDEYASSITEGAVVVIHSKIQGGNNLMVSMISDDRPLIPFSDFVSSESKKRNVINAVSAVMTGLGIISFLIGYRKR